MPTINIAWNRENGGQCPPYKNVGAALAANSEQAAKEDSIIPAINIIVSLNVLSASRE